MESPPHDRIRGNLVQGLIPVSSSVREVKVGRVTVRADRNRYYLDRCDSLVSRGPMYIFAAGTLRAVK